MNIEDRKTMSQLKTDGLYCPINSYLRKGNAYKHETDVAETFRRERQRIEASKPKPEPMHRVHYLQRRQK